MKSNVFKIVAVTFVIIILILLSYILIGNMNENKKLKELKVFSNTLIEASKNYIKDNSDEFKNFKGSGSITVVPVKELLEENYISDDLYNPTGKELTDFYIKGKILNDGKIIYEVVG